MIRFGPFEMNLRAGELRKNRSSQAFELATSTP
jgi:hypothetical protein